MELSKLPPLEMTGFEAWSKFKQVKIDLQRLLDATRAAETRMPNPRWFRSDQIEVAIECINIVLMHLEHGGWADE